MEKQPIILDLLFENFEILSERTVDERLGTKEMDVKVKWGQALPYININNRGYRPELLEREIKKINERIAKGNTVWGASYHPADGLGKPSDVSHKWTKVWMESDGTCKGELTIVPTTEGKNVQELVKRGKLGISSRGFGTVTAKTKIVDGKEVKFNDVNDDFKMVNPGDFVVSPSVEGAGNIAEEVGSWESELNKDLDVKTEDMKHKTELIHASHKKAFDEVGKTKIEEKTMEKRTPLEEEIRTNLIVNYHMAKKEGFTGTIEQWKKEGKNEQLVTAAVEFADGKYNTLEEALLANDAPEIAEQYLIEEHKVDPQNYVGEAFLAGIPIEEYAKILNANISKSVKMAALKNPVTHDQTIIAEAMAAGVDVSTSEKQLEVLKKSKQVVIKETDEDVILEVKAEKIHEGLLKSGEEISLDTVRAGLIKEKEKKEAEELKKMKIQQIVRENLIAGPAKKF